MSLAGLLLVIMVGVIQAGPPDAVFLSCSLDNDLYQVLRLSGLAVHRFDRPAELVAAAPEGSGILVLADGYPETTTDVDPLVFTAAKNKRLRIYIEYPTYVPGMDIAPARNATVERVVVSSDFFEPQLKRLRILAINGKRFVGINTAQAHLVMAQVAGFDTAVYGLPPKTQPILAEHPEANILVSTTKLSHFVTGRYAPADAINAMWRGILAWVAPELNVPPLRWTETIRASYARDETLPDNYQDIAIKRGIEWYEKSKLLVTEDMDAKVREAMTSSAGGELAAPGADELSGDGKYGIMQCYLSGIDFDGKQRRSVVRRGDNQCEAAMTYALAAGYTGDRDYSRVGANLLDYYLFDSEGRKGPRADPEHGAYGMIAWGVDHPAWWIANYGDDNARQMMGIMAAAAATGEQRWDEALALCMLANIRTTARTGFRPDRIDIGSLATNGWLHYFNGNTVRIAPHFEAYLWACFLWAYQHTGDELLYERTIRAIRRTMQNYPDGWQWTNGLAQEKARMLLPLAWLVRVKDTDEHRQWLRTIAEGLIALQQESGAIREELGKPGMGAFPPPPSNESYGGHEASLIQKNGDPVSDLLYTTNFAFLALHEAAAATGDPYYRQAEDKLAEFLCRIQVRSEVHPELDGAWFRGFDFQRWQYWASDADAGWGAWCAITGWTHPWITSVLIMRQMETSLWDLTRNPTFVNEYKRLRPLMLPENKIASAETTQNVNKTISDIRVITPLDNSYSGTDGPHTLIDGILAGPEHDSGDWLGFQGKDFEAIVDLGQMTAVKNIEVQFLHRPPWGILLPPSLEFAFSSDGTNFGSSVQASHDVSERQEGTLVRIIGVEGLELQSQFVRIRAKSMSKIPQWHKAAGLDAWLFVGEIMVNRTQPQRVSIVPYPSKVNFRQGQFTLNKATRIVTDAPNARTGKLLCEMLSSGTGFPFKPAIARSGELGENAILLEIDTSLKALGEEGYKLLVDGKAIRITAAAPAGVFYGCQSLLQLLPAEIFAGGKKAGHEWAIPAVTIEDQPRFGWRGLLLDCSRMFWPTEVIKRQIDLAAMYKINRLHLHLTDDQGWRVEIDKYPKLTAIGAWRKEKGFRLTGQENIKPYGGFYTKKELRELVEYAAARHVTVVPEIEMPGHMVAALTAYPQYSCTGGPHELWTTSGISKDVLCLGQDRSIQFVKDILDEVLEIFPSEFIHIGGDEAPRDRWKTCAKCQGRMKELGFENEDQLQGWFTARISTYLASKGRRMVGWSEILHGIGDELDAGAVVHSWLSPKYAVEAISRGHDVIMSSHTHCYLDYTYGSISLADAYGFDPIPPDVAADSHKRVLGIQGNMWTEWVPTRDRLDYQVFPRLCAYAETGWSRPADKSLEDFLSRMKHHYAIMDGLGVKYCKPAEDLKIWGKGVGVWAAEQVSPEPVVLEYDISSALDSAGVYEVMALYTHGAHAAVIEWVALVESGKEIRRDTHEAWSGFEKRDIFYKLQLDEYKPDAHYKLRMSIYVPDNGTDSNGQVRIKKAANG
ncbi:MAG: beta-N-acetylhexosaminidase [Phycisphaerae bacterium]|nr:beta-N-acetylhexosaminidase [Phycisphaerae bacterium]